MLGFSMISSTKKTALGILIAAAIMVVGGVFVIRSIALQGLAREVDVKDFSSFLETAKRLQQGGSAFVPTDALPNKWESKIEVAKCYIDGVLLQVDSGERYNKGIYVSWSSQPPQGGSGISFKEVKDQVYIYREKRRISASVERPPEELK